MSAFSSKVLVVGMDGLRFDRLIALDAPVLKGLMSTGAYGTSRLPYGEAGTPRTESAGEVVPKSPEPGDGGRVIRSRTDSGPGWSSIATGAWPDKHGVVDNGFAGAQFRKFPDFLTRLKRARPALRTAAFFSWAALAEQGAFGPEIDHRLALDGFADGWAACDKRVAEAAERHLAEDDPDALFVYLGDTDEVAHDLGPHCPEYAAALHLQDGYLGRLLDTIRARPSYPRECWTVLVTTDHGHVDEGGHGGTSDEERTIFVIAARLGEDLGGRPLAGPRLVDVAPTVLAAFGVAVDPAWDLDGAPLFNER
ncbi:alkaline phosphatase family protein [Nonomuraea candida]|uniref:alkaline phosphatase family protein n=1 Tax=Nonomuraea candida TaxID=359159 RepID=UPI0005B864DD|nr:alkaline phosphatase family protein [Nonomuraea candida]